MSSVTTRIKEIKQPGGGYLKPSDFTVQVLSDGIVLSEEENIHPSIIGETVDYLVRYCINDDAKKSFKIPLLGAALVGELDKAMDMLVKVRTKGGEESVINACRLAGYNVCLRAGREYFKPVESINPDKGTIKNIITMTQRGVNFLGLNKPVISDGFTFVGGYTNMIDSGDGDYITKDALWDFKVSKNKITNKNTLQVLIYYLMGQHSFDSRFDGIEKIGIFNPRLNTVFYMYVKDIPKETIENVCTNVIGYKVA